jgi:hypothetical protein
VFANDDFVDKKLRVLLEDAVFFLGEASESQSEECDDPDIKYRKLLRESSFTRASVLNSALLLESAANCCIATLDISKSLFSDIDTLRVISKFEYHLEHVSNETKLDRGRLVTQQASELVSIRNTLVHPKPYKSKWVTVDEKTRQVNLGETQNLKLPNSFWMCRYRHAENALKASLNFLCYYFCDLCKYTEHDIRKVIFGDHDPQDPQKWIRVHEKYGFDVRFLVNVRAVKEGEARFTEHLQAEALKKEPTNETNA